MNETLKRTPLYSTHQKLGGKIIPFAGWELPVQYSGIIAEHLAVRQAAGIFDVSHMGEILVSGPEALKALNFLTCNDVSTLVPGKGHYNAIINPLGGIVDDIIIYCYTDQKYFICVNAANTDKDFSWFLEHNTFNCTFDNVSPQYGQLALQGPKSVEIISKLKGAESLASLKYFHFTDINLCDVACIAARTGYTGEDGYEIFVPIGKTELIWNSLLEVGTPLGLVPAGLGARDSLRLEACYPLHGHELSDEISAVESGLSWIIKLAKGDFLGASPIKNHLEKGPPRSLVGFFVEDAGIVRHADKIFCAEGKEIGFCTSGTKTPSVNRALGLALVSSEFKKEGTELFAEVRGRKLKCKVTKKPFYKRPASN